MPFLNEIYYNLKRFIPRPLQLSLRRYFIRRKMASCADVWPIDPRAGRPPEYGCECEPANPAIKDSQACACTSVWPAGKQFAIVITHDVETKGGLNHCMTLAEADERFGFRASFNFVAGEYPIPEALRHNLTKRGFEIGVHGLYHRSNPFRSPSVFQKQAIAINRTLKEWGAVGFRCPSMYHDLDLLHQLDIEYDASTFDTDPFEPQPDGMGTIFPFWVPGRNGQKGYVELPYTLPQDFLLFVILQEKSIDIWKRKLDWIAAQGGMALFITHPEYMSFNGDQGPDKYPARYYEEFLDYIRSTYAGRYWNPVTKDLAQWCKTQHHKEGTFKLPRQPKRVCMLVYSFYESDNRVMRYAETLQKRGDQVDVIALRKDNLPFHEVIRGVNVYRIQGRKKNEKGLFDHIYRLIKFLCLSSIYLGRYQLNRKYQLIHVHNIPDFLVFVGLFSKMFGARLILDIHDIVPELYVEMFNKTTKSTLFKLLVNVEKISCLIADHVIIANHIWHKVLISRSVRKEKASVVLNYPDENVFFKRPIVRLDDKFIMIYPGSLSRRQGVDIAIKALALIKDRIPMAEFHIYGEGGYSDHLQQLAVDLGLKDRVLFMGSLPIYEVAERMAAADLGLEPKRNDLFAGDAMSTKILEFMSMGVPVIASDTRVHKYYFNESCLLFFKSDDENDLARCISLMFENKAFRQKMIQNSQQFVQDFIWEKRKEEYLELVDRLTSEIK